MRGAVAIYGIFLFLNQLPHGIQHDMTDQEDLLEGETITWGEPLKKRDFDAAEKLHIEEGNGEYGHDYAGEILPAIEDVELPEPPLPLEERMNKTKPKGQRMILAGENRLWPNGIIPYRVDQRFTTVQRSKIAHAILEIQTHTCVKFVPKSDDEISFVGFYLYDKPGCSAKLGYGGPEFGLHNVRLGLPCLYLHIILHELMHVVGIDHEHNRPDRDNYIKIQWERVKEGMEYNYWKNAFIGDTFDSYCARNSTAEELDQCSSGNVVIDYGTPYDFESIMHYPLNGFAKNKSLPEMSVRNVTVDFSRLAKNRLLSKLNVHHINTVYKCFKDNFELFKSKKTNDSTDTEVATTTEVANITEEATTDEVANTTGIANESGAYTGTEQCNVGVRKCIFPFTYKSVTYQNCTTIDFNVGWCATKVDSNGLVISRATCVTECSGCTLGKNTCVFPFIFQGVSYTNCSTQAAPEKPWCAITVDNEGVVSEQADCYECSELATLTDESFETESNTATVATTQGPVEATTSNTECRSKLDDQKCIFPFTLEGLLHDGCTKDYNTVYWCAVNVSSLGEALVWGACTDSCRISSRSTASTVPAPNPVARAAIVNPAIENSAANVNPATENSAANVTPATEYYFTTTRTQPDRPNDYQNTIKNPKQCLNQEKRMCRFPFKLFGFTYNSCVQLRNGLKICPTNLNFKGVTDRNAGFVRCDGLCYKMGVYNRRGQVVRRHSSDLIISPPQSLQ